MVLMWGIGLVMASPVTDFDHVKSLESHRSSRTATEAPRLTDKQLMSVLSGQPFSGLQIVESVAAGKGYGAMVFPVDAASVWAVLTDEDELGGHLGLYLSAIVGGDTHRDGRYLFQMIDMPYPIDDRYWVTKIAHNAPLFTMTNGGMWEMSWHDVTAKFDLSTTLFPTRVASATAVEWTTGAWLLIPLDDNRTLVEYFVWSSPGGHVSANLASRLAGRKLLSTMAELSELAVKSARAPRPSTMVRPDGTPLVAHKAD